MTPVEICDLLDRLAGWPWPLTPAATQARLVVELGYDLIPTPMGTMTVANRAVGEGDAEVLVPRASKHGRVAFGVKFDATNHMLVDRSSHESAALCGDLYAHTVAEGTRRWGRADLRRAPRNQGALWLLPGGGAHLVRLTRGGVHVHHYTPQGAEHTTTEKAAKR